MKRIFSVFLVALLFSVQAQAQTSNAVGTVFLSFGDNYAESSDANRRELKRNSEVYKNDTLATGPNGRLQLKFTDGSRLSLKADTEFVVAEYQFNEGEPESGQAVFKLLKGGMRTITGQIGKDQPDNYQLETTVATIGIRGTHYGVEYTPSGIYVETLDGRIVLVTEQGEVFVLAGEAALVDQETGEVTKVAPTGQTSQGLVETTSSATEQETTTGTSTDPLLGDELPTLSPAVPATTNTASSTGLVLSAPNPSGTGIAAPLGSAALLGYVGAGPTLKQLTALVSTTTALTLVQGATNANPDLITGISYLNSACSPCTISAPTTLSSVQDAGVTVVGGTKVSWGRWDKNDYTRIENGVSQTNLTDLHFIYTSNPTPYSVIAAKSGTFRYEYPDASGYSTTSFTDGTTGTLVDDSQTFIAGSWDTKVINTVAIVIDDTGGSRYTLSETGSTSLNTILSGGSIAVTGSCDNCNTFSLSGNVGLQFVGDAAEGAAISYSADGIKDGAALGVSGAALLIIEPQG